MSLVRVTSRYASSSERASTIGVMPRNMSITCRETSRYRSNLALTLIAWGQRCSAVRIGMADRMPNRRAS